MHGQEEYADYCHIHNSHITLLFKLYSFLFGFYIYIAVTLIDTLSERKKDFSSVLYCPVLFGVFFSKNDTY